MADNSPGVVYQLLAELADLCGYSVQPKSGVQEWSDDFWYQFPRVTSLAAGATATPVSVQIQNDSDFEWMGSIMHYDLAQAAFTYSTQPLPNYSVTIVETGSGKQLMNSPVPVMGIFGVPEAGPIWLAQPKVFTRNSVIQATVVNFDTASATGDIWLTLIGRKLYNSNIART